MEAPTLTRTNDEALTIIQGALALYGGRGLVSASEVCDMLLDLQQALKGEQ